MKYLDWISLDELGFPDYAINELGEVRNERTGRVLRQSHNQAGICKIGLIRPYFKLQRTVAVAPLVAHTFLPDPRNEFFDSLINLDGNRSNNRVDNLMWRPRWFAIKYHQQFFNDLRGFTVPIIELETGETFVNSWEAAIKYGLIDRDIFIASINRTNVFPTGQRFRADPHNRY